MSPMVRTAPESKRPAARRTWIARVVPVTPVLLGRDFWRRESGRLFATPLLVALVLIETSSSYATVTRDSLR